MRMRPLSFIVFISALIPACGVFVSEAQEAPLTEFGIFFKPTDAKLTKARSVVAVIQPFSESRPRYYRLRIKVDNPENADWSISIRSPVGRLLSTFDQTEPSCEDNSGCWTVRVGSSLPTVQFATASETTTAEVVGALFMPESAKHPFYSPMAGSEVEEIPAAGFSDADEQRLIYEQADNLGMFIGTGKTLFGSIGSWCCSGTRLTNDLFMTNWHCGADKGMEDSAFWKDDPNDNACISGVIDLSWDGDELGREYSCEKVEFSNKALDVAILRLGKLADGPTLSRQLRPPVVSSAAVNAGAPVTILHHPACTLKSMTRGCTVLNSGLKSWSPTGHDDDASTDFTHNCTTEGGSSGAPVFSASMELIGLHHLGAHSAAEPGNFAVSMEAILKKIQADNSALHDEIVQGAR